MYSDSSDNDESVGHDDLMKAEMPEKKQRGRMTMAKTEIEKLEEEVRQLESVKRIRELQQKKNGLLKETNGHNEVKPPPPPPQPQQTTVNTHTPSTLPKVINTNSASFGLVLPGQQVFYQFQKNENNQ